MSTVIVGNWVANTLWMDWYALPRLKSLRGPNYPLAIFHGSNSFATSWLSGPTDGNPNPGGEPIRFTQHLLNSIDCLAYASDWAFNLGGVAKRESWGRDSVIDDVEAFRVHAKVAAMASIATNGKLHLMGASQGAYDCVVYALRYPDRVASLLLLAPGMDIEFYRAAAAITGNPAGAGAKFNIAHGLATNSYRGAAGALNVPAPTKVNTRGQTISLDPFEPSSLALIADLVDNGVEVVVQVSEGDSTVYNQSSRLPDGTFTSDPANSEMAVNGIVPNFWVPAVGATLNIVSPDVEHPGSPQGLDPDTVVTGVLNAVDGTVTLTVSAANTNDVVMVLSSPGGDWDGAVRMERDNGDGIWTAVTPTDDATGAAAVDGNDLDVPGQFRAPSIGYVRYRAHVTTYVAGSVQIDIGRAYDPLVQFGVWDVDQLAQTIDAARP